MRWALLTLASAAYIKEETFEQDEVSEWKKDGERPPASGVNVVQPSSGTDPPKHKKSVFRPI